MSDEVITLRVGVAAPRVDKFLSQELPQFTRSAIQRLFDEERIRCMGKSVLKSARLNEGTILEIMVPAVQPMDLMAEDIPLDVVYEDTDLLVVNKPKGMVVHPAPGHDAHTLVHALLHHCGESLSGINGVRRPGIVHRIDKDTSGLLLVAKNDAAHTGLAQQIKAHSLKRQYEAVVYGNVRDDHGNVDAPIGRNPKDRKKMAVLARGQGTSREAVTHYQVKRRFEGFTQLSLELETGRTHQIRVHMAYTGHPVAGDPVYGPKKVITALQGQCLHAGTIGFIHPVTNVYMEFTAPLPEYFTTFLEGLRER